MTLPPVVPGPPNAVVQVQPGMAVQAVCAVSPLTASTLITGIGRSDTSVNVQPGMTVRAVVLVDHNGHFFSF